MMKKVILSLVIFVNSFQMIAQQSLEYYTNISSTILNVFTTTYSLTEVDDLSSSLNAINMEKQEKEEINKVLDLYEKSLNTSDAKLAQSLYAKDGIFMPAGSPSAIGTENILKSYEFIFTQIQLNIDFFIDEIEVEGNFAFATTSSKGTTRIHATDTTLPEANRELFVFEKINGEWKIARYMFNKTSPQK